MKAAALSLFALVLALPAAAQDTRTWSLIETEDSVMLFYGTPDSDDLWAGLSCRNGSNEAVIHLTLEHRIAVSATDNEIWIDAKGDPEPWEVEASINGLPAEASALNDEMNGGSTLTVPAGEALLRAMDRRGQLRAEAFGEVIDPPPFRRADFQRFLQVCKG